MQEKPTALTPALYDYLAAHNPPPDPVLRDLAAETPRSGRSAGCRSRSSRARSSPSWPACSARGARSRSGRSPATSAISIARGLVPDGRLLCCDLNEEWTAIACRYFARAGLAERMTLRIGPAIETLRALPRAPEIDLAFIDADKIGYRAYYKELLPPASAREASSASTTSSGAAR
jgi:caffeoyl-CoA O-methyltransferase